MRINLACTVAIATFVTGIGLSDASRICTIAPATTTGRTSLDGLPRPRRSSAGSTATATAADW
jgi:hypothetical protein